MVYYHLDRSQRYLQSLDLGREVQAGPLSVEPHGLCGSDNSKYFVESNRLAFGDGGIDDAEDADVIWHEYGHALLEAAAPGLLRTNEGVALHEGWADYWAASYSRHLEESGKVPIGDWRKVFTWDGNQFWNGRRLDALAHYPEGLTGQVHTDGLMWATTLMQVHDDLGAAVTDRLVLLSHAYLNWPVKFSDAAEAVLQADADSYADAHRSVLLQHFAARGFVIDTGTDTDDFDVPPALTLHPNFPDPFTDQTTILFTLAEPGRVSLAVYNLLGQRVADLEEGDRPAGPHTLTMQRGNLAAGVYFLRLMAGGRQFTERLVVAR